MSVRTSSWENGLSVHRGVARKKHHVPSSIVPPVAPQRTTDIYLPDGQRRIMVMVCVDCGKIQITGAGVGNFPVRWANEHGWFRSSKRSWKDSCRCPDCVKRGYVYMQDLKDGGMRAIKARMIEGRDGDLRPPERPAAPPPSAAGLQQAPILWSHISDLALVAVTSHIYLKILCFD